MTAARPERPVRAVLFDLDGTLVDSRADIALSVNHTLTSLGFAPLPVETVQRHVGDGVRQLLTRSAGALDAATPWSGRWGFSCRTIWPIASTRRAFTPACGKPWTGWRTGSWR
jgi:phosphoglycolate phosphatase-like HAD superfamily hydrolase